MTSAQNLCSTFDLMSVTVARHVTFYMEINHNYTYKFCMKPCVHDHNCKHGKGQNIEIIYDKIKVIQMWTNENYAEKWINN
jgi:hypothetical protein